MWFRKGGSCVRFEVGGAVRELGSYVDLEVEESRIKVIVRYQGFSDFGLLRFSDGVFVAREKGRRTKGHISSCD